MKVDIIILTTASLAAAKSLRGYGLIGYGISMYDPICAYACHDAISRYQLSCSITEIGHDNMGGHPSRGFETSDNCYATDDNFLRSVAYCINLRCVGYALSDLEYYWANFLIGRKPGQVFPKESYSGTLGHTDPPPDVVVSPKLILNQTTLVSDQDYSREYDRISSFRQAEITQSGFGFRNSELSRCVANRMGMLSFANFALLVLYAGRNNILLSITDWSYSTFLLLHRWIAIICTLEACVHASIYLKAYLALGEFATEMKKTYWIWGIVAVLLMSILLPASSLPLRQKFYNLFLASHFAFALVALVGCYFHVYYRYMNQWGYETWIYIAFSFWAFDRVMRVARLARNGVRKANITVLDENYIRIDIPNVTAQGHAYLYFPTITWLVWENHPFSILGTTMADETRMAPRVATSSENSNVPLNDQGKALSYAPTTTPVNSSGLIPQTNVSRSYKPGLTFFVSTAGKGLTTALRTKTLLPVLVEASYAATSLDELRLVPNCILVAGGVGISAVVTALRIRTGRTRLFWGIRSKSLVEAVSNSLGPDILVPGVIGEIAVGRRLNLRAILEREVAKDGETAVVVCGPNTMADEVRAIVSELGRKGRAVKLIDEAFSW
ncbi:putative rerric reductase like transmembrane component [Daldinia eschscholtzii]|nr:putative rerric reductase like transmembrane component [Daldinia eschscholtzii]